MTFFYPSSTFEDKHEPFELQVSRGLIAGHRSVHVFGYNSDVDTTEVTVWPHTGKVAHPTTSVILTVSSTNANDTAAGTGARTVVIQGLDSDYRELSETVTLNGQTGVSTVNTFRRINYAYVASAGSSSSAEGDIYIGSGVVTAGVPASVYNLIKFDYNNTVTAHFTVPAGYTGYVMQGLFSAGQSGGTSPVRGRLLTTGIDGVRRTAAVTTVNNGVSDYAFEVPIRVPEKTDIEATALGISNNNEASAMFIILLVEGSQQPGPGVPRI